MLTAALSSPASSRPIRPSTTQDQDYHSNVSTSRATASAPDNEEPPPHIRIVPHLDSPRSLVFSVIERDVREGNVLKIGRFTDRYLAPNRITFRSKVVSRGHAEIWTEGGKFYIRDTRSSSGTFLNHVRLSAPNQESRPFLLKDGDIVQLGVDYQGGTEEIYRAVKMRLELNRMPSHTANTFSLNTFQSLRNLTTPPNNVSVLDAAMAGATSKDGQDNINIEDCCICLFAIAPFQALFVAPCSHTFHYKCCRPLLQTYPGFLCPLCRNYADLDASVTIEASEVLQMLKSRKQQEQQCQNGENTERGDGAEASARSLDATRPSADKTNDQKEASGPVATSSF